MNVAFVAESVRHPSCSYPVSDSEGEHVTSSRSCQTRPDAHVRQMTFKCDMGCVHCQSAFFSPTRRVCGHRYDVRHHQSSSPTDVSLRLPLESQIFQSYSLTKASLARVWVSAFALPEARKREPPNSTVAHNIGAEGRSEDVYGKGAKRSA